MTKRINISLLLLLISGLIQTSFAQNQSDSTIPTTHAKNIILMIGDGMGIPQIYAAMAATSDNLNILRCKNTALVKTLSANDDVTDSAAAGTALATGSKTNNGSIGVSTENKPLKSILKIAEENQLSTGLVVTSEITHATPAAFVACVQNRSQASEIAKQFLNDDVDVFIGGGLDQFSNRTDKLNLIDSLKARNYQIAYSVDELGKYNTGKLAGLLYPGHAPKVMDGRGDMLPIAASKALDLLSQNDNGFFLMIEGSQIDFGGHDKNIKYVLTELTDFDKAVGVVLDFAEKHPETLVIITADHETGGLTLVENGTIKGKMQPNFSTDHHSASPVALFAFGKGADQFKGMIDNTDVFKLMLSSYGFTKNIEKQ